MKMERWSVLVALLFLVSVVVSESEGQQLGRKLKYFNPVMFSERVMQSNMTFTATLLRRDQHEALHNPFSPKSFEQSFLELLQRNRERASYYTQLLSPDAGLISTQAVFESPVLGSNGEYVMTLSLGTPPQSFSAVLDTGSDLNWIQCSTCSVCFGQGGVNFDPAKSSTFRPAVCSDRLCTGMRVHSCGVNNVCQYDMRYADTSSTIGDLAYEAISFNNGLSGTSNFPNFAFGCGRQDVGFFAGTKGIVGLGQGPLSLNSQLSSSIANVFSYCISSRMGDASSTLTVGAIPAVGNLVYTPMVKNPKQPTFYYVQLNGISVGEVALSIDPSVFSVEPGTGKGGVILDSGTTFTFLSTPAFNAVLQAYRGVGSAIDGKPYGLDLCWASNPAPPPMVLHFQGADLVLQAENLLVQREQGVLCLAMMGTDGFSIIGNIQQANHLVVYDVPAQRIGFAAQSCSP